MAQSKADQLRALREARAARREEVVPVAKSAVNVVARPPSPTVEAGAVPWLAPEGICPSCDKRRAALQKTMRKRREKGTQ